ncbi:MAG: valine--tRNA ligase [Bernardetiaceae bacterium]|nr:valine--tRNA ligase [Bernardetiaceae bacterium]
MQEIAKTYNPEEHEDKWYAYWLEHKAFEAHVNPNKKPYTIVIPPPNVTGVLHMGHLLNNTIQDILTRRARMQGYEACWVPGTDHASIATEAKVVRMLREKGIKKSDLTREKFLEHAWEWKEKYGGIILNQLQKLGAGCDWSRTNFTLDEHYYKGVLRTFVDLYQKGYIYRGLRMINWDCEAQTALSNEEVLYKEEGEISKLYKIQYAIQNSDRKLTIATTRPETILADTAIAVNPKDERYQDLIGKHALVPFLNRPIPIIADDYVDKDFGTGCLKVTPAHDPNDYEIGQRHHLEVIDMLNNDGSVNENCGIEKYVGKDRFALRKEIVKDLEEEGYLIGTEEITNKVGRSERTGSVVEPKLSLQWFVKMKEISKRALEAVEQDEVQLHPAKFKNTYRHWMENVRDWCISRQLWWGQRIPAYYYSEGENDFVVAATVEEALEVAREATGNANLKAEDLRQDEDVLDTWASSWLWPLEVFNGISGESFNAESGRIIEGKNAEFDYFYPTSVLVTGPDILFFWVARMIIAGYEYTGKAPFKDVYLTGLIRDKLGRKMSKSLGNSPDALELIEKYGADGVRVGLLFSSPAGNDLPFDEKLCEQGRNFSNKIWNAMRLIMGFETDSSAPTETQVLANQWFEAKLQEAIVLSEDHYSKFRISDVLLTFYKLIWGDFCSQYLELIKPEYGKPISAEAQQQAIRFLDNLMRLLHPFMPFLSETLWHTIGERKAGEMLARADYPNATDFIANENLLKESEAIFELISQIRNTRNSKQISPKEPLDLHIKTEGNRDLYKKFMSWIQQLGHIKQVHFSDEKPPQAASFVVRSDEFSIPMENFIDVEAERENLEKELKYTKGFLQSVSKKLSNKGFVNNAAPAVVEKEQQKKADAEAKIQALEAALADL